MNKPKINKPIAMLLTLNLIVMLFYARNQYLKIREKRDAQAAEARQISWTDKAPELKDLRQIDHISSRVMKNQEITEEDFDVLMQTLESHKDLTNITIRLENKVALLALFAVREFTPVQRDRLAKQLPTEFQKFETVRQQEMRTSGINQARYLRSSDRAIFNCLSLACQTRKKKFIPVALSYVNDRSDRVRERAILVATKLEKNHD